MGLNQLIFCNFFATKSFYLCSVKKVVAIFFLVLFLTANTAFGEVLRLPVLFHHYMEHVEWDNNSSLLRFLSAHYASKIAHPDDQHHDHERLPFKTSDCQATHIVTIVPQLFSLSSEVVFISGDATQAMYSQPHCSDSHLNSIWQPPRFS